MGTGMFVIFMLASDLSEQMQEIAVHDQLTGVLNRRGLIERCANAYASARRNDTAVTVVMTDIDRFKTINDDYGHATGDAALVHFAESLRDGRRAEDIVARLGGEEFALILPGAGLESAVEMADELCHRIDETPITVDGVEFTMTASFGVATLSERDESLIDTIVRADRALYRSKRAGRNQIDLESSQLMLAEDGTLKPLIA
jgi:diguanylate cyclase (GGDEF)-like protein